MPFCVQCGTEVPAGATSCPQCGRRVAAARGGKKRDPVLWIVLGCGCAMFAVAATGIVAAIVIPNFVDALHKAKQKRTVSDLRTIGTTIEAYRVDHDGGVPDVASLEELIGALGGDPEELSAADGWGHPLRYECERRSPPTGACDSYRLASPGRDGVFEHDSFGDYPGESFPPQDYDRDIVYGDGFFLQFPASPGQG
jgi:type II secretory pathway pseudopilin PulG